MGDGLRIFGQKYKTIPVRMAFLFMILEDDQILELIISPLNKDNISLWQKEHEVLDIYYNGGDVSKELEKVKNYENDEQKKLRDKIARSTKDFLSNLINPFSKVFSATGSNTDLDFSSEAAEEKFKDHLEKLPEGISMRKWMEVYWKEAYITDPNGLMFVESESDEENPKSYPTYKSINVIHDYSHKWGEFEYIIFVYGDVQINEKTVKVYRVYDEVKDGLYYVENRELKTLSIEGIEQIITHNNGFVPAVLCSDIVDKQTGGKRSFIHKIDEALKEYMRDSSIHSIYKFLHGFPIFWRLASKCITCNGEGQIIDKTSDEVNAKKQCPTCKGKRLQYTTDVSDGVVLPVPKNSDAPKLAPDIAGYVQPDLETWQKQLEEMQEMKKDMHFALWGTYVQEDEKSNTATGRFIDAQPVNDTLEGISDVGQNKEERLVWFQAKLMYKEIFKDVTLKYGRRYLVETPDILWEKYIKAKESQAPVSSLDYFYRQFLLSEYHNDLEMLDKKEKEFFLEPFPHYSLEHLKDVATYNQIQKKLIFSEWSGETEVDYKKDFKELKQEFETYYKDNLEKLELKENEKITES